MEQISGRVLLVEDHEDTALIVRTACDAMGFEVEHTNNGSVGLQLALEQPFLLIILDVGLPGIDGISICQKIRQKTQEPLIVFLTSESDESSKVRGLESGADDYVTKPFSVRELSARIRTLLRRRFHDAKGSEQESSGGSPEESGVIRFRDLSIDLDQRKIIIRDEEKSFTSIEFSLLLFLIGHAGRAVSREELMQHVWGFQSSRFDGTVNSHMSRVRAKLEANPSEPEYIHTIRGFGYRFADKDSATEIVREQ